jgi:aminodeoxyfutalosine synthase
MAGSRTPSALSTSEIETLITDAGRQPIERDTLYNVVKEHPKAKAPEASMKVRDRKRSLEVVS